MPSNGITHIPNFIQIRPAILELKHTKTIGQYMRSFYVLHAKKALYVSSSTSCGVHTV
jgi:phage-related protein